MKINNFRRINLIFPSYVAKDQNLQALLVSEFMDESTEIFLRYRENTFLSTLEEESYSTLNFAGAGYKSNDTFIRNKNNNKLIVTLHRKGKCVTRNKTVIPTRSKILTFIQMDKPLYKPNDLVRFRLFTMKNDLKGIIPNNIVIKILDGNQNIIETQNGSVDHKFEGLYEYEFQLSKNPIIGNWTIEAEVGLKTVKKSFTVIPYSLQIFDLNIEAKSKIALSRKKFDVLIHAKYAFGGDAKGNAIIEIKSIQTGRNYVSRSIYLNAMQIVTFDFKDDFQITSMNETMKFEITVEFKEQMIEEMVVKKVTFALYPEETCKIHIFVDEFYPDSNFVFSTKLENFYGNFLRESDTLVKVKFDGKTNSGSLLEKQLFSKIDPSFQSAFFKIDKAELKDITNFSLSFEHELCKNKIDIVQNHSSTYLAFDFAPKM